METEPKLKNVNLKDQSVFLVIGNTFRQGTIMLQGMILARLLTPADFGSFRQVILVITLLYTFTYLSIAESSSYFLARLSRTDQKKFTFQSLFAYVIMGNLALLIIILSRDKIAHLFNNPSLAELLLIASIFPMSMMVNVHRSVSLVTIGKAEISSILSIVFAVLHAGTICIIAALGYPLIVALKGYAVVYFLDSIVSVLLMLKYIGIKPNIDMALIKEQYKFSIPYWFSLSILFAYMQIHKLLVSSVFNPEKFALFSVGAMELPVIGNIAQQIALVLIPVSVQMRMRGKTGEVINLWEKSAAKVALITMPVFMILVFSAKTFIVAVWGSLYEDAWVIFIIISLLMPLKICDITSLYKITGNTKYVIVSSVAALIVGLGSGYLLIAPLGLLGPALGMILGKLTQIYLGLFFIRKDFPIKLHQAFAFKYVWKITLVSFLACVIAKFVTLKIDQPIINFILNSIIGGGLFLVFALKFSVLNAEDTALIKKWITLKPLFKKA
ncbi:oligosaccharide flippase family protein [candidate division KSB1 bacterium]|nr:oligosaccharide flippase family protein [candidate division KSB1 bacterium]